MRVLCGPDLSCDLAAVFVQMRLALMETSNMFRWKTLIAASCAAALFLILMVFFASHERAVYQDYAVERLQRQASVVATASATLLNEVDQTLIFAQQTVQGSVETPQFKAQLHTALRTARATTQLPSSIFALDADGRVFVTSSDPDPDPFPLSDVDFAVAHIGENPVEGVFVGAARVGRLGGLAGRWILGISRPVRDGGGQLVAIIVAAIPIERLTPLLEFSHTGPEGVGAWVSLDGRVLLRDPFDADAILKVPATQVAQNKEMLENASSGATEIVSYVDGVKRTVAWQLSDIFPIAATVAVSSAQLTEEWSRTLAIGIVGSSLFCAILLIGGYLIDLLRHLAARDKRLVVDKFEHLLSGIKDVFVAVDRDMNVTEFNASAAEFLGRGDIKGMSLCTLFPEIEEERNRDVFVSALHGRRRAQIRIEQPEKGETFMLHVYPFLDGVAILAERLTERISIEARLHQSQKMEALGQLTGGIAHDFNNLLTVIVGNAEALLEGELDAEGQRNAQGIVHGAEQAAELTQQLLAFARQQPLTPRSLELNRHITSMDAMLRRILPESIAFERDLNAAWPVWVDPSQLESALLNIVINARDAMPEGGKILIETSDIDIDLRDDIHGTDLKSGHYVLVSITDTGIGMPADVAARAFDPFFSTKPEGSGTGLGLSMVYGFARQSGGQVSLYSEPGHGTTVRLYLPRSLQGFSGVHVVKDTSQKEPLVGGSETVLIVEDNPLVRTFASNTLKQLGYKVVEVEDAAKALALFESGARFDLVLSDVVLSGDMSGPAMVEELRRREFDFALLFMSGYPKASIKNLNALGNTELLGKPFKRDALARAVRAALERGP
jgi:signal transduction histidine kinase